MRFLAIEHELPSRIVTNDEVRARVRADSARHLSAADLDTLDHLIQACFDSAGTTVRYHRSEDETATELAVRAGRQAIESAALDPLDVDLVMYVGIGRGVIEPASATIYQDLLGLRRATAFDVLDACASYVRALQVADQFLRTGTYRNILLVNAECVARESYRYELRSIAEFAHWHPVVTIGEAATATIVTSGGRSAAFESDFRTWGEKRDLCFVPLPNVDGYFGKVIDPRHGIAPLQFVSFGLRLMDFGARKLVEHYRDRPQFKDFDADVVFGHSASDGMSRYVLDECGIDPGKARFQHSRYANTVSASVPLGLSEAHKSGALTAGDRVLVMVASAGVTTGLVKFVFQN